MKPIYKIIVPFVLLLGILSSQSVFAGDIWYVSATASVMPGNYSGSKQRNSLLSSSIILNADYLDAFSFSVAYNNFKINFKPVNGVSSDINQDQFAGRMQYHFFSDLFKGRLTAQLVAYDISNDDITKLTDDVSVISPGFFYRNINKTLSVGIEYVRSKYSSNNHLVMTQWTPSFGFGFNNKADWLGFKAFLIDSSDRRLSQGEDAMKSLDIKWTHWLAPDALLNINHFFISVLAGQRIFAVDNDAFSVYNLADVQKGSLLAGVTWKLKYDIDITSLMGLDRYENKSINDSYNQQYLYLGLTKHW